MFINFKNRADMLPSSLILGSILILVATLLYMVFIPMPSAAGEVKKQERNRQSLMASIASSKASAASAKQAAEKRIWHGTPDTVMAGALALLTQRAGQHNLHIAAFRPQKSQALSGVTELPFSMQIAGPYPSVLALVNELSAADDRMTLRSLQVAAADGATNSVTITAGLSAYLANTPPAAAPVSPAPVPAKISASASPVPSTAPSASPAARGGTHG